MFIPSQHLISATSFLEIPTSELDPAKISSSANIFDAPLAPNPHLKSPPSAINVFKSQLYSNKAAAELDLAAKVSGNAIESEDTESCHIRVGSKRSSLLYNFIMELGLHTA